MSIVNRRNAVLGWGVWKVGKVAAKRKARQAVRPAERTGGIRRSKGKVLSAAAATGGAVWFWRRRRGNEQSD
jgi:hypothetical protein